MDGMMILVVLLRLIHIVAAVSWFGAGLIANFVLPVSAPGTNFFVTLYRKTPFGTVFAITAGITTLAGLLLYATGSPSRFTQTGNMVLGIGALFGILATGHGGMATGRITEQYVTALEKPDGATSADTAALYDKMKLHTRISFAMMVIALIGMGSARYL